MAIDYTYYGSLLDGKHSFESISNEKTTMDIYGTLPRNKHVNKKNSNNRIPGGLISPLISDCSSISSRQFLASQYSVNDKYSNHLLYTSRPQHNFYKRRGTKRRIQVRRDPWSPSSCSSRSSITTLSSGIFSSNSNQSINGVSPSLISSSSENTSSSASSTDYTEAIPQDLDSHLADEFDSLDLKEEKPNDISMTFDAYGSSSNIDYGSTHSSTLWLPNFNDPIVYQCFREQKKFYKQIYEQQFAAYATVAKAYSKQIQAMNPQGPKVDEITDFLNSRHEYGVKHSNQHIPHQHLGLPPLPPPCIFPAIPFGFSPNLIHFTFENSNTPLKEAQKFANARKPSNAASNIFREQIRDIMMDKISEKSLRCPPLVATASARRVSSSPVQTEFNPKNSLHRNGESGYHSESPSPPAPSLSSIPVTQTIPTTTVPGNPPIASNVSFPSVTVPNMYYDPNEISHMDVLSEQIFHFHSITAQTEFTLDRKLQLRDMLYYAITPIFPMCGLYVVGSSLNGFGTNNSDMDLCLMLTSKDLDQKTDAITVLKTISESLHNAPFVKSQHLIDTAKVPILRLNFNAPFEDVTVDLNANNSVAIRNTHLLCYYATFDWRVRPLVAVVKEWAKQRGINESTRSSFTSYSLVLMVINYLQYGAEPSVLPSLQKLYPNRFSHKNDIRMLNVSVPLESTFQTRWTSSNNQSLGELLLGFLEYYSNRFSYETEAISVRLGKTISREKIMRHQEQHQGALTWNCIWIEEPFTRMNTAHSVFDWNIFENIKKTFVDSYHELRGNSDFESFISKPPLPLMGIKSSSNVEIEDVLVENNTSATQLDATDPNMKPELNPE